MKLLEADWDYRLCQLLNMKHIVSCLSIMGAIKQKNCTSPIALRLLNVSWIVLLR